MKEKAVNKKEAVKSTMQTIAVSAVALALAWAPFVASAAGGMGLLTSHEVSVIDAKGVFASAYDVSLTQRISNVTGHVFYVLDIDGEEVVLNLRQHSQCRSELVGPASNPQELSFSATLFHKQWGGCSASNPTHWELGILAFNAQGRVRGFLMIEARVRSSYGSFGF